jgi:putative membrane protein
MTRRGLHLPGRAFAELSQGFDHPWKSRAFLVAVGTLAFFFPFSLFFVVGDFLPDQYHWMSSVIIVLGGIATFLSELRSASLSTAASRFLIITGVLFTIEFVGVKSGVPFGRYVYTERLGLLVAGVPVAISVAWYSTVINAWRIAESLSGGLRTVRPVVTALLAGLLTLGLDVALEPMAGFIQKYWLWESHTVPVQNYVSWFVLSVIAVFILATRKKSSAIDASHFRIALFLYGFHFVLFVLTILVNGYILAPVLALVLVLAPFALRARRMRLLRADVAGQ